MRIRPFDLLAFALCLQRVVAMLVEHVALLGLQHAHPVLVAVHHHGFQYLPGALLPGVGRVVPAELLLKESVHQTFVLACRHAKSHQIKLVFRRIVQLHQKRHRAAVFETILERRIQLAPVIQLGDQRNRVLAVLRLGTARRLLIALELLLDDVPFFVVLNGGQDANSEPSGTVSVSLL